MPKQTAKKPNITRKQKIAAADEKSKNADAAASKTNTIEYQETPVKSDCDDNEYRAIKLSNGLNVVLVSNPRAPEEEKHASAAKNKKNEAKCGRDASNMMHMSPGQASFTMSMNVGSFHDPPEVPCVANILGNVVLKSSQNYPQANSLLKFVTKNKGGLSVSANHCERTTFYVHVSESQFVGAIERFVDCFVAPLLRVDDVEKERKNILDDVRFQNGLAKFAGIDHLHGKQYLLDSIASSIPGHPGCNLGPEYKNNLNFLTGQRILEEVETFMKRHYSAQRMFVVIEGRLPLDTLQIYAQTYFSKIPNNGLRSPDYTQFSYAECFNTPEFRMMYQMNSCSSNFVLESDYELELNWPMPSCHKLYRSKPQHYLAWIMNYKGKGSLISYLKSKGWCQHMDCGINKSQNEGNGVFNIFNVTVILTNEGYENRKQVLDAIFSYINLMRREGPQKRIWDEIRKIEEAKFRFDPIDVLDRSFAPLHDVMVIASPVDYLRGGPLYLEYSHNLIKLCLDLLAPDKANIIVFDCNFDAEDSVDNDWEEEDHEPPHYRRKAIPEKWIDYWKNIEPLPEFRLPEVNNFICDDYKLVNPPKNPPEHPINIHSDDISRVWYKLDVKFLMRENFVDYFIRSPLPAESPENGFMMDLFVELLGSLSIDDLYPAKTAGLSYRLGSLDCGLSFTVSGKSKKTLLLAKEIARYAGNLENIVTEDVFKTTKEELLDQCWYKINQPLFNVREVKSSIVKSVYWSTIDKYTAAENVDFAKFKDFAKRFAEHIHIDCLAQGNLGKAEVIENVRECVELFKCQNASPNAIPYPAINEISRGTRICRFKAIVGDFGDTAVVNYYQFGDHSLRHSVMVKFLTFFLLRLECGSLSVHSHLSATNVFPSVDWGESYGYCVWSNKSKDSDFEPISTIEGRNEKFRAVARKLFEMLSEKEWKDLKKAFIEFLEEPAASLNDEVTRNRQEIVLGTFVFDKLERESAMFKTFAIEDLREGMMSLLVVGPGLRKLSVQSVGNGKSTRFQRMRLAGQIGNQNSRRNCTTPPKLEFLTNLPREEEKPLDVYITDIGKYKSEAKVLPRLDLSAMIDVAEAIRRDCNV